MTSKTETSKHITITFQPSEIRVLLTKSGLSKILDDLGPEWEIEGGKLEISAKDRPEFYVKGP